MSDLTEWLLVQIAEDEREAKADAKDVLDLRGRVIVQSPARLLAECDSKRRIIEGVVGIVDDDGFQHSPGTYSLAEDVLISLALPYADRPGYREEWRP